MVLLAITFKKLVRNDFRILRIIERFLSRYEYVPVEIIERYARIPSKHVALILRKLNRLGLVERKIGDYTGYRLTFMGLDILALKALVDRGVLSALGDKLGVGKESDVYVGITPSGEKVIVKLHKLGRTSFRGVTRVRAFATTKPFSSWLMLAKISGQREYRVLEELYRVHANVPAPISYSRHAVVAKFIEGIELYRYKSPIDPDNILSQIVETIRKAYLDVGVVHGDLSEYNVMVSLENEREKPYIIDWPQYVEKDHPSAEYLLRRDIEYIARFFEKKYRVIVSLDKLLKFVKGEI